MSKTAKTTMMCDVCHKPIVEDVYTDLPWHCLHSAEKKQYFQVCRADGESSTDCCSMECVTKALASRINNAINMLVKLEVIYYEK